MLLDHQLETYETVMTVEKIEAVVGTVSTTVNVYVMVSLKVDDQYETTVYTVTGK